MVQPSRRSVTSHDVAERAGVSQSAVSLVFSGKAGTRVSARTAERIRRVAAELGYAPNVAASALRLGEAPILALAVPTITQPFFSSVLLAAERRARESGYAMILLDSGSDGGWVQRLADLLRGGVLAGAIAYAPTPEESATLTSTGLPLVFADVEHAEVPCIRFDFSKGARDAARHLLALGHRRIGYLAVDSPRETYQLRFERFADEIRRGGGDVVTVHHSRSLDFDAASVAANELLDDAASITAVMSDDDLLAAAVVREAGAGRVPSELSVVGVGNIELARLLSPALTTIELSAAKMGSEAVDLLLRAQEDGFEVGPARAIASTLVTRDSTAPARSR